MSPGRSGFLPYAVEIIDDAGGVIDPRDCSVAAHLRVTDDCWLVGYETGFEPTVWAVRSHLGVQLDADEAEELVRDYLVEKKWFSRGPRPADFLFPPIL